MTDIPKEAEAEKKPADKSPQRAGSSPDTRPIGLENATKFISIFGVVFFVVRIFAVAGWDQETALGVFQQAGTGNILIGSLIAYIPVAVAFAFLLLYFNTPRHRTLAYLNGQVVLLLGALTVLMAPVDVLVGIALVFLALRKRRGRGPIPLIIARQGERPRVALGGYLLSTVAFIAFLHLTSGRPWTPPERLVLQAPAETTWGWIMKSDNDRTALLTSGKRKLITIDGKRIVTRELCDNGARWEAFSMPSLWRLLLDIGGNRAGYVPCDLKGNAGK